MQSKTRKSDDERLANLKADLAAKRAKLDKLQAEISAKDKRRQDRRAFLIGYAVLAHLEAQPSDKAKVGQILDAHVKKTADREMLADLMPPRPKAAPKYSELPQAAK